jgi:hypothetical protein
MIRKKNIFLLLTLAAVLLCGCGRAHNTDGVDFFVPTGYRAVTDSNTLVFSYDKELVVFDYKNGRWRYHSRFSVMRTLDSGRAGMQIGSLAVKGDIIAVGVEGFAFQEIKGVVEIYQRNTKDSGWDLLKILSDPDPVLKYSVPSLFDTRMTITEDSLFGSLVAVTEDCEVVTFTGHHERLDVGLYLYDCRSEKGYKLYAAKPSAISYRELFESSGRGGKDDIGFLPNDIYDSPAYINNSGYYFYYTWDFIRGKTMKENIAVGKNTVMLRIPFLDRADALANTNIIGRMVIFEKKGEGWEIGGIIGAERINLSPKPEGEVQYLNFLTFSERTLVAAVGGEIYAFEQSGGGLWEPVEDYGYGGDIGKPESRIEGMSKVAFDGNANETIAVTMSFDDKYKIELHRRNESGWEMTDEIMPEDLPEIRTISSDMPIVISNDVIVVGTERPPYAPPYVNDNLIIIIIDIIKEIINGLDTTGLNKYPGRVCIYRLLPEQGYVLEDIIVRDRDEKGELYFKSALY